MLILPMRDYNKRPFNVTMQQINNFSDEVVVMAFKPFKTTPHKILALGSIRKKRHYRNKADTNIKVVGKCF